MATRYTYKTKVSLPITYQWKCSKCGTINRVSTTIHTDASTMSYGRRDNSYQRAASGMAYSSMEDILSALYGERSPFSKYSALGLSRACKHCYRKEPWAVENRARLSNIGLLIGIVALFFSVIGTIDGLIGWISGEDGPSAFLNCLAYTGCICAFYFILWIGYKKFVESRDKKIAQLPFSALPILVINDEPIIDVDLIEAAEESAKAETSPPVIEQNNNDFDRAVANKGIEEEQGKIKEEKAFCHKCGKPLHSGSKFCSYCGTKIDD